MDNTVYSSPFLPSYTPVCTVYSLCDDTLASIFLWCNQSRPHRPYTSDYDSLSLHTSPWVLSYVCRHWRILVLSSPLLWTTIELDIPEYVESEYLASESIASYLGSATLAFRLKIFLRRSSNVELNVKISDRYHNQNHQYSGKLYDVERYGKIRRVLCHSYLIPLLLPTTARWHRLNMEARMDLFEAFSRCSFERLRSLAVWQKEGDQSTFIHDAPLLTELKLSGQVEMDLDWAKIQTFTAARCTLPEYLPQMIDLRVLHFDKTSMNLDSFPTPFVLPFLRTITIQVYSPDRFLSKLPMRLCAPALDTLELLGHHSQRDATDALPMFDNTDNLTTLIIALDKCTEQTIALLTRTPSITTLFIGADTATPGVIDALGLGVLPRLKKLGVNVYTLEKRTEHFISMLESRARRPDAAISEITITGFDRVTSLRLDITSEDVRLESLLREKLPLGVELWDRWDALRENMDLCFGEWPASS